jgi:hypothetical protein
MGENGNALLVAQEKPYSADGLSELHFFKGAGASVPAQEQPMAFDPVNAVADKLAIISVHDDIASLKIVRLF